MVHDLDGILDQMDALAEIDTEGVEPMAQVLFRRRGDGDAARGRGAAHAR